MQITLTLNDKKLTADVAPDTLLIDFVRSHGCLSVKRGCETSTAASARSFSTTSRCCPAPFSRPARMAIK